jgi:hypothetical protein
MSDHGRDLHMMCSKEAWICGTRILMEQSPSWEADIHLAVQEVSRPLWNPKVHYHVLKGPPLDPVLSHMNPVHILTPYFCNIRFNIILPYSTMSPKLSLLFVFLYFVCSCVSNLLEACEASYSCQQRNSESVLINMWLHHMCRLFSTHI